MSTKFKNHFKKPDADEPRQFTKKVEILAEINSIDGSQWRLCLHPLEYRRDMNPDLDQLLENSNGNPFFNPAFLAASRDRVTRNKIYQLIVWEVIGEKAYARLTLPTQHISGTLLFPEYFQSLTHPFAPFGDPLFAKGDESNTLSRFLDLIAIAFANDFPPLIMDYVSAASPINQLALAKNRHFGLESIELGKRASINGPRSEKSNGLMSKKRKRELNRLLKKLRENGLVTFEKVTAPIDIILRFEEFLLLETSTWKGKHGTSIHTIKRDAAFARQSVSDLAKDNKCEIFSMRLDNKVLASIILFKSAGNYFPWKIAFDTEYSHLSPGSQLMLRLSEDIIARKDFKSADSLAIFGNSWMTRLWPDETSFEKMVLAKNDELALQFAKRLKLYSSAKQTIKKLLRR